MTSKKNGEASNSKKSNGLSYQQRLEMEAIVRDHFEKDKDGIKYQDLPNGPTTISCHFAFIFDIKGLTDKEFRLITMIRAFSKSDGPDLRSVLYDKNFAFIDLSSLKSKIGCTQEELSDLITSMVNKNYLEVIQMDERYTCLIILNPIYRYPFLAELVNRNGEV